jgi:hypothetical protein
VHHKLDKISDLVAREAEEDSTSLVYFSRRSPVIAMEGAEDDVIGVDLRLNVYT